MREVIEAAQYRPVKFRALAVGNMSGRDFRCLIDRAILRSRGNGRNVPQIELSAEPEGSDGR
jgi:hypothetical protein